VQLRVGGGGEEEGAGVDVLEGLFCVCVCMCVWWGGVVGECVYSMCASVCVLWVEKGQGIFFFVSCMHVSFFPSSLSLSFRSIYT
jgi:hypothetical protein